MFYTDTVCFPFTIDGPGRCLTLGCSESSVPFTASNKLRKRASKTQAPHPSVLWM